jgi:endonuclease/exonuclease/phosphatase family metal-dependent hydrolase
MRVLTLNLWKNEGDFPDRLSIARAGLIEMSPDIMCLQEVYCDETINALDEIVGARLPHHIFAPAREKLRDGHMSCSGVAIASKSKISDSAILDLPSSLADGGRVAVRADIVTDFGPLRVVSLHLSYLRGLEGRSLREAQWDATWRWAHEAWSHPIILAGDYNALIHEPWLESYLADHNGQASAAFLAGQSTLRDTPNALIDHLILAGQETLTMKSASLSCTNSPYASDHYGIVAEFEAH